MTYLRNYALTTCWMILAALLVADAGIASAEEGKDKGKRGLRKLIPKPFKKEDSGKAGKEDKAVEDMREFAADLTGEDKPAPTNEKPVAVKSETAKPPASASPAPVEEKRRRGLFKMLRGKDEAGGKDDKVKAPTSEEADAKPESSSDPEPKEKRSRLLKIPFVGGGDEKTEVGAAAAISPAEKEASPVEKQPRSRLLRLPFTKSDSKEKPEPEAAEKVERKSLNEPPQEAEAEIVEEPAPREKKGGLFRRISGGPVEKKKKEKPPAPAPSSRDLGIGEKYIVSVGDTPFYSIGPSQPLPPDEILSEGRVVTMRKAGWGWSDIELAGGKMGVVATKNLRKATSAEAGGSYASRRRGSTRGLFKVLDFNPAPEPELPSDAGGLPLGAGLLPPLDDD